MDPRPPKLASGLRLGAPALTTRGFKEPQMVKVAGLIDHVLGSRGDEQVAAEVRRQVTDLCKQFPVPH